MKMSNPLRKIVLAIHEYKNWVEVIISIAKRQKTTKLILKERGSDRDVRETLLDGE